MKFIRLVALILLFGCGKKDTQSSNLQSMTEVKYIANNDDGTFEVLCKDGRIITVENVYFEQEIGRICSGPEKSAPEGVISRATESQFIFPTVSSLGINEAVCVHISDMHLDVNESGVDIFLACADYKIKRFNTSWSAVYGLGQTLASIRKNLERYKNTKADVHNIERLRHGLLHLANNVVDIFKEYPYLVTDGQRNNRRNRILKYDQFFNDVGDYLVESHLENEWNLLLKTYRELCAPF